MSVQILTGDCRSLLAAMPDQSVHCCVTSPPYWGQRDYGVEGQAGREQSAQEHLNAMVEVFREVRRVLRDDGTLWVNYGDSWASKGWKAHKAKEGTPAGWDSERRGQDAINTVGGEIKERDLIGMSWMLAFALRADGWWLRDCIVWHKPNPMPSSVPNRTCPAHEYLFMFSKVGGAYFYDAVAIEEPITEVSAARLSQKTLQRQTGGQKQEIYAAGLTGQRANSRKPADVLKALAAKGSPTRKRRSVWSVAVGSFEEAHFATFPPDLIEPCIKAGCPARCCARCGAPWVRQVEKKFVRQPDVSEENGRRGALNQKPMDASNTWQGYPRGTTSAVTLGFAPSCACEADTVPGTVLDPFGGAGTTGLVADRLGRNAILMELNPEYAAMARRRIEGDAGMFAAVQTEAAQ